VIRFIRNIIKAYRLVISKEVRVGKPVFNYPDWKPSPDLERVAKKILDQHRAAFDALSDGPKTDPEGWWGVWNTGLYRWVRSTSANSDEGIVAFPTRALAEEEARLCTAELRERCVAKSIVIAND
jgi:hypothetical protein